MSIHWPIIALVTVSFFVISFVTNILDPLMPNLRQSFGLDGFRAGLMAFSFFIAYGIMSIPAGMLAERLGPRPVLVAGFAIAAAGGLAFALWPSYGVALPSLFTIAIGFAMLQVVINPLLRVAGGEARYAFFGNLAQLVFGAASFLSPFVYAALVDETRAGNGAVTMIRRLAPPDMPWIGVYWIIAALLITMVIVVSLIRFPAFTWHADDRMGSIGTLVSLARTRVVALFFIGIFCYVGTEQGVALSIAQFLSVYHGIQPAQGGHLAVAWFWGAMLIGCACGLLLLKHIDARRILVAFGIGAAITLLAALLGPRPVAMVAFPLMGFWCSVMWPVIFSLALNSLDRHHGPFAGILCTGIVGGAFVPAIIGHVSDHVGLQSALLILLVPLGYIISIGIWARPLVGNLPARGIEG